MTYNYHTHTYRCGHATGTEEEYIKRAIENGIEYMGFSDHMPFAFPDGYESSFRVPLSQVSDYILTLSELREKYKGKVDLRIGFEMEYYPKYFQSMLESAVKFGAEYLILGQHYIYNERPSGVMTRAKNQNPDDLREYVSCVVAAIKSGAFTYVAHPDAFNFEGDISVYREEIRKICIASREYDIPLEINFLGIRGNRHYPNGDFWSVAGEEKSPVTFGFDAHDVKSAFDGESLATAENMVEKYGLNYIGRPKLRSIGN